MGISLYQCHQHQKPIKCINVNKPYSNMLYLVKREYFKDEKPLEIIH